MENHLQPHTDDHISGHPFDFILPVQHNTSKRHAYVCRNPSIRLNDNENLSGGTTVS
jgi:hypothetical protein